MRNNFNTELRELGCSMLEMAAAAEDAIDMVAASLSMEDGGSVEEALALTKKMDQMERDIENRCFQLLLTQQPVASDMRTISAALKMVTDLQRIGVQCANIAEMSLLLSKQGKTIQVGDIRLMSQKAGAMVKQAISAYVNQEKDAAQRVVDLDEDVDQLFQSVKSQLVEIIAGSKQNADQAVDYIIIAKYLERVADHAVNIAQWAIYCVTGQVPVTN